jgi:tetratricopeptide (TPR) repeat protein
VSTDTTKDFFISYTHADKNWAEWIAWRLEVAGYTTILQAWDFHAGGNFVLAMDSATQLAQRTIAVLSPDYFASKYTPSEWAAAFRHDPKAELGLLVPVRVRICDVEGLLGQVVFIDLVNQDEQKAQSTLLASLQPGRQKLASAPPFPSVAHTLLDVPSFPGALPRIWNIPYPRNAYFTGREDLLTRLAAALQTGQTTALSQPQAISGLGGIGKTQTALEYAYRCHQHYQAVLWARADTYDALVSAFVAFAELLQLPEKEEKDQLKVVQAVKDWLKTRDRWLLILDNADDLALVKDFLPPAGGGHTLLTTRATGMGRLASRIEVETLAQEVGALFLLRRTGLLAPDADLQQAGPGDRVAALEITRELGGLPLALDQAGAYIEEMQYSLPDYLQLYRGHRAALLKERGGHVADHPEPVATTWFLSFSKIEQTNAAAADLLRLCAFLHPDAIPEEIITGGAAHLGPQLQAAATNPLAWNLAINALLSYSLLRRSPADHLLTIHRLTQAVLKDGMDAPTYRLWAERTVQAVDAVLPEVDYSTTSLYERCLSHAQECVLLIAQLSLTSSAAARLLYQTAWYLHEHARYVEAEPLYQQALHIWEQALGKEHPQVAYPLNGLAYLYEQQGKYAEAEPLYQRALHVWEQAYGPGHPLTRTAVKNYAILLRKLRRETEALSLEARFPSSSY